MGIFDTFKAKKPVAGKKTKYKAAGPVKASAKLEEKRDAVLTADGTLVSAPKKEGGSAKKAKPIKDDTGNAYRVLRHPHVSEKGSSLAMSNQYVFVVAPETNKIEIRKAIKKVYGVDPIKVTVINVRGKYVRYGKSEGTTKRWKKAIISLPAGQKIDIQEGL